MTDSLRVCSTCGSPLHRDQLKCRRDGTFNAPAPGTLLFEKYEFIEPIGEGGMGIVFKAKQVLMNHTVAIKMLQAHSSSATATRRFQEEARTMVQLTHPNIVAMRDFGVSSEDYTYIVMDFLEGTTLSAAIEKSTYISESLLITVLEQICDALIFTHRQGIYHRDIKPSNIMLSSLDPETASVKLMDFGIAKRANDESPALTRTGEALGSPMYMSPEQITGGAVDGRADLYSLGCVIFECLTGVPPFPGETAAVVYASHMSETPPSLREASLGKKFSKNWESLVANLLKKNPDERLGSASQLKEVVEQIRRKEEVVLDGTATATAIMLKPVKSKIMMFGVVAAVIAVVALAAVGILGFNGSRSHEAQMAQSRSFGAQQFQRQLPDESEATNEGLPQEKSADLSKRWQDDKKYLDIAHTFTEEATLVDLLNKHRDIVKLKMDEVSVGPALLEILPKTQIEELQLTGCDIDARADLKLLAKCNHLITLNLSKIVLLHPKSEQRTFDDALADLAGAKCKHLLLNNCQFTDAGLKRLSALPNLSLVDVGGTSITGSGLEILGDLPKMAGIFAPHCSGITPADRERVIKKHPNIWVLLH